MSAAGLRLVQLAAVLVTAVADPADSKNGTWERSYRVWFTRSHGDDHVCLTELVLQNEAGEKLPLTYKSQTSCYGCASCDGCKHRYGDPLKQFDGVEGDDNEDAWTCTAPGSFHNGLGSQSVAFTLPSRPRMLTLARPSMDGDWIAQDWAMEEQQDDGTWWIIVQVTGGAKALKQSVNVPKSGGKQLIEFEDLGPGWTYEQQKEWPKAYASCAGNEQSPIVIDSTNAAIPAPGDKDVAAPLMYSYSPMKNRALFNTGLTVQVAGNFGNVTVGGEVYDARQFHLHVPAEHKIGDERSVGELHIVHQKQGSRGTDDLLMVSIVLRLPLEHQELVGTEPFFTQLGFDKMPGDGGHSVPFAKPVDLNDFAPQLNGHYYSYRGSLTTPPCSEGVQWYVMAQSAVISGATVVEFKDRFPNPMNSRLHQALGERTIATDGPVPEPVVEA